MIKCEGNGVLIKGTTEEVLGDMMNVAGALQQSLVLKHGLKEHEANHIIIESIGKFLKIANEEIKTVYDFSGMVQKGTEE